MDHQPYLIVALKRSGQHGIINWLAQQMPHDVLHFNDCCNGWDVGILRAARESMAVFYNWDKDKQQHSVKNYWHDWKKNQDVTDKLILEFEQSLKLRKFNNTKSILYNVEDLNLIDFYKFDFSSFSQLNGSKNILIIRSAANFAASCLNRLIISTNPDATDVADKLTERMQLWKQHAREALNKDSDFYVIKFDKWFVDIEYREQICFDLGLTFTDNGLNSVMNFGDGSSFDEQNYDNKAQDMKVIRRWIQFPKLHRLLSYLDDEVNELNNTLF